MEDEVYSIWATFIKNLVQRVRTCWFSDQSLSAFFQAERIKRLIILFCVSADLDSKACVLVIYDTADIQPLFIISSSTVSKLWFRGR